MRYLTVLRHAKAASDREYERDFDRPLTSKGHKQVPRVAPALAGAKKKVDHVVASPALRAVQTAERLVEVVEFFKEITYDERIYGANVASLLAVLREQPESAQHVVLVGHNPGMEELVSTLCGGDEVRVNLKLSTAALAHLHLEVAHWRQVRPGCGLLRLLTAPRFNEK